MSKPIHAKPSLYAYYFYDLKEIALKYGYNLVLHGSLNRDLDLIAIPWQEKLGIVEDMIKEIADYMGGYILQETEEQRKKFRQKYHGRMCYVVNLNRECRMVNDEWIDPLYYIDISVILAVQ